jgi:hypothetical protein
MSSTRIKKLNRLEETIRDYFDSSYLARVILDNNENELYNTLYINLINYDISSERSEDEKYDFVEINLNSSNIHYLIKECKEFLEGNSPFRLKSFIDTRLYETEFLDNINGHFFANEKLDEGLDLREKFEEFNKNLASLENEEKVLNEKINNAPLSFKNIAEISLLSEDIGFFEKEVNKFLAGIFNYSDYEKEEFKNDLNFERIDDLNSSCDEMLETLFEKIDEDIKENLIDCDEIEEIKTKEDFEKEILKIKSKRNWINQLFWEIIVPLQLSSENEDFLTNFRTDILNLDKEIEELQKDLTNHDQKLSQKIDITTLKIKYSDIQDGFYCQDDIEYEIKELNVFRITNEEYTSPLVDFSLIEICNTYNNKITFGLFDDGCSQHYIIEGYSEIVSAVKEWEIFKEKMKFEYNDEKDIIYSYDSIGLKV